MSPGKTNAPDAEELGQRLREAREYTGLSQEEVARALEIRRPAITEIEAGKRSVKATELRAFASLYGVSETELLNGKPDEQALGQPEFLARAFDGLNDNDMREVARFAEFLKNSGRGREE